MGRDKTMTVMVIPHAVPPCLAPFGGGDGGVMVTTIRATQNNATQRHSLLCRTKEKNHPPPRQKVR
jgi:hypothetical protein